MLSNKLIIFSSAGMLEQTAVFPFVVLIPTPLLIPVLKSSTFCKSDAEISSFANVAFILLIPPNLLHFREEIFVAINLPVNPAFFF